MKKKPIPTSALELAAEKFADGTATRRSLQAIGIPQRQYPAIAATAEEEMKHFRHALAGVLGETAMDIALRLKEEQPNMSVAQLAVPLGILVQNHKLLSDAGQPGAQHLHLHLGDKSRQELMKGLLGVQAERVPVSVPPLAI